MTAGAPHDAELVFEYPSVERARIVKQSVRQEVGEIDGNRTRAIVKQHGKRLVVRVTAEDPVRLRAGLNSWMSLVGVANQMLGL